MSDQNSNERFDAYKYPPVIRTDTTSPVSNLDAMADKAPVDAVLLYETPMGGPVAAADPMGETPARVVPMAAGSLTNEAIVDEAPLSPEIPYQAPNAHLMNNEPLSPKVNTGSSAALLEGEESEHFRTRWTAIQGTFVDDPRVAVQQADVLVTEVVEHITQMFAREHTSLETQWNQGSDVSTEDLRKALQHYRAFFNRLVI